MKKVYLALMCLAVVAMFTACDEKKTNEPEDQTTQDTNKPGGDDDTPATGWAEAYRKAAPGIYMNGNDLLAKGTDGSAFHIEDVTVFPRTEAKGALMTSCQFGAYHAYDGKWSTYEFWQEYYNEMDDNIFTNDFKDTIFYKTQTEWDESSKEMMEATFGPDFMYLSNYTKIADASDFEGTYKEIAKRYQTQGPIVPPSKMVLQYKKMNCQWLSELYPKDMEDKGYVFKYTGSGKIASMEVDRVFEWGKSVNNSKVDWLPKCNIDDVAYVIVKIDGATAEDVKAYIAKIKKEGHYLQVTSDIDEDGYIAFGADSDNYNMPEGKVGYVYPTYEVLFFNGILTIEFTVSKVGGV